MHPLSKQLIELALSEDIGLGDITTDNLVPTDITGQGVIIAKETLVLAGLDVAKFVFMHLNPQIKVNSQYADGEIIQSGEIIATIEGSLNVLLKGERTALNFLQRLSGIATHVRSYVDQIKHTSVRLTDTRKTTPGFRSLEKYAVRIGGAYNHRMALYDGVLIKDNHINVMGGIKKAVDAIRHKVSHLTKIEVEVSNIEEVKEALSARADVIMLDNMDVAQIKKARNIIDKKALVEVSGNVTKKNLLELAETGVDIISVGALTHSATSVDISMNIN